MIEGISNQNHVDAAELWQIINNYGHCGHLLEVGNYDVEDDKKVFSDYFFSPIGKDGQHIGGWWPKRSEVDILIQERLLEPRNLDDNPHSHTETRKYELTTHGEELASLGEEGVLAYFRKRNIREDEQQ